MIIRYRLAKAGIIGYDAIENQNLGEVLHIWRQFIEDEEKRVEWEIAIADRIAIQTANSLAPLFKALMKVK